MRGLHPQRLCFNWTGVEPQHQSVFRALQIALVCSQDWGPLSQGRGGRHVNQPHPLAVPQSGSTLSAKGHLAQILRVRKPFPEELNVTEGHSRLITDQGVFKGRSIPVLLLGLPAPHLALFQLEPFQFKEFEPVKVKLALLKGRSPPEELGTGFHTQQEVLILCLGQGFSGRASVPKRTDQGWTPGRRELASWKKLPSWHNPHNPAWALGWGLDLDHRTAG